jgi:hypothetical protein
LAIKEALEQRPLRRDFSIAELMDALTPKSSATMITAGLKVSDLVEGSTDTAFIQSGLLERILRPVASQRAAAYFFLAGQKAAPDAGASVVSLSKGETHP